MQKKKDNSNSLQKQEIEAVVDQTVAEIEKRLPAFVEESITRTEFFSGPVPHPDVAKEYEKILPGFTERTLQMAERSQGHEIERSGRIDRYLFFNKLLSISFAFLLIAGLGFAGYHLLMNDKNAGGLATLIIAVTGVIGAFYNSKKEKGKSLGTNKQ